MESRLVGRTSVLRRPVSHLRAEWSCFVVSSANNAMGYTPEDVSSAQSDSQPLVLVDIGVDSCEGVCWWSAYPIYIEEKKSLLPLQNKGHS
jgi:hypothetical protein